MPSPAARFEIADSVTMRLVDEQLLLVDLETGTTFGLSGIGSDIWTLLGEGRSCSEICERLLGDYEVARETLAQDVAALVDELQSRRLIVER